MDIRTGQEQLGHSDGRITQIYNGVLQRGSPGVKVRLSAVLEFFTRQVSDQRFPV